jgi:hypothetical protein
MKAAKTGKTDAIAREMQHTWEELLKEYEKTGNAAEGMGRSIASGIEEGERRIEQAVSNLHDIWNEFRNENERAFGEIFQGPWFQSETWQLAQEWGVAPTIQDINKDLRMQIADFRKYRGMLAKLGKKKGIPPEMIKELRALGPEAMPYLEAINKAAPKQLGQFISMWKTKQTEIEKATKIDFDDQLKQWNKFGSDIALQIILGLRSQDDALDKAFRNYITDKFPNIIAQAKKEAIAEFKRQQALTNQNKKDKDKDKSGGGGTSISVTVNPAPGEKTKDATRRAVNEAKTLAGYPH